MDNRKLKIAAAALALLARHIVSYQLALLMLMALLGLYLGCGVLIAVYRFVGRLE